MSQRLDRTLVERGLARSRQQATEAIRAGQVQVNGRVVLRPSTPVEADDQVVSEVADRYVSRAAHKLSGALTASGLAVPARVLDAGASTGGFTQVVLEAGAEQVYAVDVGHGQLVDALRADSRVVVRERLNLRDLTLADLDDAPVDLVVADVSFISLKLLLEPLFAVLSPAGHALLLVKPQFEVGRAALDTHGVVIDPRRRRQAVEGVIAAGQALGRPALWQGASELPGEAGNVEFFVHFGPAAAPLSTT
ncbi:MAG: TlyA family rRNA (cytidine-2'-O)-methyltransferase [Actinobacteria bacterium HGW-Actinobacteria-2]|nr:MAG: TlyA family rRNA (cytidine-2'-O)-methyltransferase [Actinobacteria bacterium HGW-Actinobacteria-2]